MNGKICAVPNCNKLSGKKSGYCSMHRSRLWRTGQLDKAVRLLPIERVMERIIKRDNGCWEWQGGKNCKGGYGRIKFGYDHHLVHRISYEYHYGKIPDGMEICHHCDNPICVNPEHLFLGTRSDNMRDMFAKGRHRPVNGENNGNSRLTQKQVDSIRKEYSKGDVSQRGLARKYSVTQGCIAGIICHRTWKESLQYV